MEQKKEKVKGKHGQIRGKTGANTTLQKPQVQLYSKNKPGLNTPKNVLIKTCQHPYLQPLEFIFGKHKGAPHFDHEICDWSAALLSAHRIRVYSYWCPTCNKIIKPPKAKIYKEK